MWVIRYFICDSNIVETPFASDVGNNTRPRPKNPIAHNAFDTRYTTLVVGSFDTQAYLHSLNNRTLSHSTPEPTELASME